MTSSSIDINASGSGARLLSLESPVLSSINPYYNAGSGEEDLSLSELSLFDQTVILEQPFSLLARAESRPRTPTYNTQPSSPDVHHQNDSEKTDDVFAKESPDKIHHQTVKQKEEKLQSDIFILKKLNASFGLINEALQETGSANQVSLLPYGFTTNGLHSPLVSE